MSLSISRRPKVAPVAFATVLFATGLGLLGSNPAQSIGGLCNGQPASRTWLDASGQPGVTLIDGTNGDDVIIGSDGDDNIDAGPGDDGPSGGPGNDTVVGGPGDDDPEGGPGHDFIVGGEGDDWIKSSDDDEVDKVNAGDGFDICFFSAGDELANCEY